MTTQNSPHSYFHAVSFVFAAFITFLVACSKDDTAPLPPNSPAVSKIQFAQETYSIAENEAGISLDLKLLQRPARNGKVAVKPQGITAVYGSDYITEPALINGKIVVPVEAGNEKVIIRFIPLNNDQQNIAREITFLLEQEDESIKPEGVIQSKVIITDDENGSLVSFQEASVSVTESSPTGYRVQLSIQPAATEDGFIDILVQSATAVYNQHYNTLPAASNGTIRLPVQAGNGMVSFVVYSLDNQVINEPRILRLALAATSGQLKQGIQKATEFTIEDNDREPFRPIASIRSGYFGQDAYFVFPVWISGVVTSVNNNIEPKTIYIEDANGGIAIRLKEWNQFQQGDVVMLDLHETAARLSETNGILNLSNVPNGLVKKIGFDRKVIPQYTPAQLYQSAQDMEGRIITLKDVWFTTFNGSNTLYGEHRVTDGARQVIVRTEHFASFAHNLVPSGTVSITGILINRNGEYTILPQTAESIR